MEGETQGEMVLMYTIHNTQLCGGGVRFTCQSHQKNRGKEADALTGTVEQRLPRLLQTWSLQARRGHRAEREGRELTDSCGSHGAVGPRTGQARHPLWRPRRPACLGTGALEEWAVFRSDKTQTQNETTLQWNSSSELCEMRSPRL